MLHSGKSSLHKALIAVGQMTAIADLDANYRVCRQFAEEASAKQAKMLFLPENFAFLGDHSSKSLAIAEPIEGDLIKKYRSLAKEFNIWLSLGGFQEKAPEKEDETQKLYNTHIIINDQGDIITTYRKIHLFELLNESQWTNFGEQVVDPVDSPIGKLGVTICYDLRFPELYLNLALKGADIFLAPSAFLQETGKAHWEILLKARAIENQCYMIAAAQWGPHHEKRTSYGHSMVVDPWGKTVAEIGEGTGLIFAEIDPEEINKVRARLPSLQHRRKGIY